MENNYTVSVAEKISIVAARESEERKCHQSPRHTRNGNIGEGALKVMYVAGGCRGVKCQTHLLPLLDMRSTVGLKITRSITFGTETKPNVNSLARK